MVDPSTVLLSFGFFGFGFFVFAFSSTSFLSLCFLLLFAAVAEAAFLIVEDTAAAGAAILLAVVVDGIVDEIVVDIVAFVAVAVAVAGKAGGGGGGGATVLLLFSVMVAEAAMGTAEVAEGGSTLELEIEDGNDGSNSVVFDVERGSGGRGADGSGAVTSLPTATAPPDADDGAIISVADADAKVETAGSCFELSLLALWLLLAVWSPRPLSATGIAVSGAAAVSSAGGGVGGIIMVEMNCFCVEGRDTGY